MSGPKPTTVAFYKMHSLGNDFMVIDGISRDFAASAEQIKAWADRNRGVGFDQLLVIEPPTDPAADFWYKIYNADGSEAEQCGNGTRCVTQLVHILDLSPKDTLVWQSLAGSFQTERRGEQYSTQMTVPVLDLPQIPVDDGAIEPVGSCQYQFSGEAYGYTFTPVSMGNPHAVIFVDNIFDLDVEQIGAQLTQHPAFPNRANVGFCQIADRQFVRLRVYERGTGETQACGTGACAAVVAARLSDLVDPRVKVSLPGGKLRITWNGEGERVDMSGPSTLSYQGEITTHDRI